MNDHLNPLLLDLCEWLAKESRPYQTVMEAWRTSCPRLDVWEEAVDRGYVERIPGTDPMVRITEIGKKFLGDHNGLHVQRVSVKGVVR